MPTIDSSTSQAATTTAGGKRIDATSATGAPHRRVARQADQTETHDEASAGTAETAETNAAGAETEQAQQTFPELRLPTIQDVWRARDVIAPHVYHTPLLPSHTIGAMSGTEAYLKAENLQRSGSYKIRGATYKLSQLTPEERARGVIAASAGNHSQGVAIAARALGIDCTVVMPVGAPLAKVTATQNYGAKVILYGETVEECFTHAHEIQAKTGATFIHAFKDAAIGAASMRATLDAGRLVKLAAINTIADGIATKSVGEYTYAITRSLVDEVITVDDDEIIRAVLLLMERCKLLVE